MKVGGVFCFSYFVAQLLLIHVVKIFSTNEKCTNVTLVFISCCALVITREVAQSLFFVSGSLVPSVFFVTLRLPSFVVPCTEPFRLCSCLLLFASDFWEVKFLQGLVSYILAICWTQTTWLPDNMLGRHGAKRCDSCFLVNFLLCDVVVAVFLFLRVAHSRAVFFQTKFSRGTSFIYIFVWVVFHSKEIYWETSFVPSSMIEHMCLCVFFIPFWVKQSNSVLRNKTSQLLRAFVLSTKRGEVLNFTVHMATLWSSVA